MTFLTIHTPPVVPPKRQDTYRATLTAKLGKIPSMAELARRETLAAKRTWERCTPINQGISITAEETLQRRTAWAKRLLPLSPVTTLVACQRMGRAGTGIELDPDYFAIACKRVDEAARQPDLLIPETRPAATQEAMDI